MRKVFIKKTYSTNLLSQLRKLYDDHKMRQQNDNQVRKIVAVTLLMRNMVTFTYEEGFDKFSCPTIPPW